MRIYLDVLGLRSSRGWRC